MDGFNFSFLRSCHVRSEVLAIVLFASSLQPATPPPANSHSERKTKMKMKNKPKLPHIPTFTETQFFLLLLLYKLNSKNLTQIPIKSLQFCQMGSYRHSQLQAFSQPSLLLPLIVFFIIINLFLCYNHAQKMCLSELSQTNPHFFHS